MSITLGPTSAIRCDLADLETADILCCPVSLHTSAPAMSGVTSLLTSQCVSCRAFSPLTNSLQETLQTQLEEFEAELQAKLNTPLEKPVARERERPLESPPRKRRCLVRPAAH